ncbi:universal stress protein [Oceanococcus atlanticus]|uniref:universal stress protein n=1 Tax=Oceanococcus atlanticus TaxID=1317117 RepID=UPI0009F8B1CD|nr:universal stress protein [Oceanococcus atlanticus]RZO85133.1 MAG: universal stress protein [Oceanococcus sp.]
MYQSILCLVALNENSRRVVKQAKALSERFDAQLRLLHVVEYVPLTGTEDAMLTAPIPIAEELESQARAFVTQLADDFALAPGSISVVNGDLTTELETHIQRDKIDLVVIGNHCRSGLAALFNHAEDTVLHRCACDMLAVSLD